MALTLALSCVAALFGIGLIAVALARRQFATVVIYSACLLVTTIACITALWHLLTGTAADITILPLGLPWVGAHFRLDALAAAFLVLVNLGSAGASLYALGYGRHEIEPARVLPFFPVFLAAMN